MVSDDTDYTKLTPGEMLAACADNASKWSRAFCQFYKEAEGRDIDEGWVIGWFANAMMATEDLRLRAARALLAVTQQPRERDAEWQRIVDTEKKMRPHFWRDVELELKAELKRIRPVYDAACAWRDWCSVEGRIHDGPNNALADAIDTARSAQGEE